MNDSELEEAFKTLRVKPGCTLEQVMHQYRLLAMIWHPDRVNSEEEKRFAEDELKKINHAKDVLGAYFKSLSQMENNTQREPKHSEIARQQQGLATKDNQLEKLDDKIVINLQQLYSRVGLKGWIFILVVLALLTTIGQNNDRTMQKSPPDQEVTKNDSTPERHVDITLMEWGRQKTFDILVPPGQSDQEAIDNFKKQEKEREMNTYHKLREEFGLNRRNNETSDSIWMQPVARPQANLPATPGINAPLPSQAVQRSGLPLMPLGARH